MLERKTNMPFDYPNNKFDIPFAMIRSRIFCFAVAALWLSALNGNAQTIQYTTEKFDPKSIGQNVAPPDAVDLVAVSGGPAGKIWFRQGVEGIFVYGKLNEKRPQLPRIPLEIKTHAHVDLWIAGAAGVSMPEIGWGNQFGPTNCRDCLTDNINCPAADKCRTWSDQQETYRKYLRKLFVRQWHLAPKMSKEDFAAPAYAEILDYANDSQRPALEKLKPSSNPQYKDAGFAGNWEFEILVRWSNLPPYPELNLSNLYIVVEAVNGDGTFSSTAPGRKDGDPSTFNKFQLERPVPFVIGLCQYPLTGSDKYGETLPAWYLPNHDKTVSDIFVLRNEAAGYQYEPEGLSPIPAWTHHFTVDLGSGKKICGPLLASRTNGQIYRSGDVIDRDRFSYKKLPDGSYLLRSGPAVGSYTRFGAGAGGANPTIRVNMYHLGTNGAINKILSIELPLDFIDLTAADVQFSSDWKNITVYRHKEDNWSSTRYCLKNDRYEECGAGPSGSPPNPRPVKIDDSE